jgi:hypothetical protein
MLVKNAIFGDVTPTFHIVLWLLVTDNVPSPLILVTVMAEAIRSCKTSVLTRATWHNIPEVCILKRN